MSGIASFSVRRAGWVIGLWLAVIVGLNTAVPQLEEVIAGDNTTFVPDDAPSVVAFSDMDRAFGSGEAQAIVFVAGERDGGLTPADHAWFVQLGKKIASDSEHVVSVTDVESRRMWNALLSKDREAVYLQVGLPGEVGAPQTSQEIHSLREEVARDVPDGLEVAVTGPAATITDTQDTIEHDIAPITLVTVGLIALIVFLLYRSFAVTGVVLGFIGASLAAGRGMAALGGELGWFHVSTFTASILVAIVLGAATDYAIFLLSRFHELRRAGVEPREAAAEATRKVASVILGSALTVVLATASMALAQIGFFNTTGPAVALAVACTLFLCLSLLPAMLVLVGARGLLDPRPARSEARWAGLAAYVVAHPARVLSLGLVPLVLLAALFPAMELAYDQRRVQPEETESNDGYALLARHFPENEILADYLLVTADHDLRNPRDLAAIEQAARAVAGVPGVVSVRTVTRPLGEPLTQASLGYQVGVAGERLGKAGDQAGGGADQAEKLSAGATRLSSGATRLADGAQRAADGAGLLVAGAEELATGVNRLADGATTAKSGSTRLRSAADQLADGLEAGVAQARLAVDGLGLAYDALATRSLTCGIDPACRQAREGIRQIWVAERDELLPGMRRAATAARAIADGTIRLDDGLAEINDGLAQASAGADELRAGQDTLAGKLGTLADGADRVADGTSQVAGGTEAMAGRVGELAAGLLEASSYLSEAGKATRDPAVGGFYLPPAALDDPRMALARGVYISRDGRSVRMIVLGGTDAFGNEALDRSAELGAAAERALAGTRLDDASVQTTGMPASLADIRTLSGEDFRLVAWLSLLVVLLILLVLLRSIVASLFLLASVILSYAAAMGLGALVWQVLLDKPLDWSVPSMAFVLLVAVGADYNMLLIKRIRDEAPTGDRAGIARALTATGSVITAAGLIFAASVFAMMAGSVTTLQQIGFTIGMGLLLDTFVVRTFVVPAFAALVGPKLWWPSTGTAHH